MAKHSRLPVEKMRKLRWESCMKFAVYVSEKPADAKSGLTFRARHGHSLAWKVKDGTACQASMRVAVSSQLTTCQGSGTYLQDASKQLQTFSARDGLRSLLVHRSWLQQASRLCAIPRL